MDHLRLGRIDPVRITADAMRWEHGHRFDRGHQFRRKTPARQRLLSAVAPGHDPDSIELDFELDAKGRLLEVTVRDRATGSVIRHLSPGDLEFLGTDSAPGMLFERRG